MYIQSYRLTFCKSVMTLAYVGLILSGIAISSSDLIMMT